MPLQTFFNLAPEKRQRILDCAIDEFAANDFDSASISRVVAQAGIAKGSLYQYFTDKSDLYQYLLELAARAKTEMMNELPPEMQAGVFERLHALFRIMMGFELRHPKLAKIGSRSVSGRSPLPEEILRRSKQNTRQYFATLVEEGKRSGEIRQDVDAETAAMIFTATLTELGSHLSEELKEVPDDLQPGNSSQDEAKIERIYRQFLSILQNGMATKAETR